jgi:hypothetical protein
MLRYHVAFYLPNATGEMVVAEALDFPGAVTQGFDLPDADCKRDGRSRSVLPGRR